MAKIPTNVPDINVGKIEVEGKVFDCTDAKVKTYHPKTGEYVIGGFWEVKEK